MSVSPTRTAAAEGAQRDRRSRPARAAKNIRDAPTPVRSLARALRLLEGLADEGSATLSEIAQRVGLPASTAHRLLRTLEQREFVVVEPHSGLWSVGVGAFTIGNAFLARRDYVATALPQMRALMETAKESVNLGVLMDGNAVFLSQVLCEQMMLMVIRPGDRAPAHASGVGKALLAALPKPAVDAILHRHGLARFTANTLTSATRLEKDLAAIRRRGYAFDDEEHAVGLRCVAAAIHDEHGEPLAAISLSGPRARIADPRVPVLGAQVRATAERVTRALGGKAPAASGGGTV